MNASALPGTPPGESPPRPSEAGTEAPAGPASWPTLVGVCVNAVTLPLSLTVVGVTLPRIAADFDASFAAASWVVNGYNLAFCAPLLAAGALADLIGRRLVFAVGVAVFTLASLLCGLSDGVLALDLARALQGCAAALVLTSGTALLAAAFRGPARARAFGLLGASFGVGLALGPVIGGVLVDGLGWRWAYLLPIPFGLVSLLLVPRMAESRDQDAARLDLAGAATFTLALSALMYALVVGPERGWTHPLALGALAAAAVGLAAFILAERVQRRPMFDLSLFANPTFVAAQIVPLAVGFGFVALLVNVPLYLQAVEGASARAAGLAMLPLTVPVFLAPYLAGRLSALVAPKLLIALGLGLIAAGLIGLGVVARPGADPLALAGGLVVAGIGTGLAFGLMDNLAVSVVPTERSGMASGIFSTFRLAGDAFGIAIAGAILFGVVAAALPTLLPGATPALADAVARADLPAVISLAPAGTGREAAIRAAADAYAAGFRALLLAFAAVAGIGAVLTLLLVRERDMIRE